MDAAKKPCRSKQLSILQIIGIVLLLAAIKYSLNELSLVLLKYFTSGQPYSVYTTLANEFGRFH